MFGGWVYLVHDAGLGLHKVGYSSRLTTRVLALAVKAVGEFRLVGYIASNFPTRLERHFKETWAAKHVEGEWYRLDPADVAMFRVTSAVMWKDTPKFIKMPEYDPLEVRPASRVGSPRRRDPIRLGEPIARRARS